MLIFSHPLVALARAWLWLTDPEGRAARWRERWAAEHGRPWPSNVPPVGAESTSARKAEARRIRWEREHLVPYPGFVTPPSAACDVAAARRRRERQDASAWWKPPEALFEGEPLTAGECAMIRRARAKGIPTLSPGEPEPAETSTLDELLAMAKALDARILALRAKTLGGELSHIAPAGVGMVAGSNIRAGATVAGIRLASGTLVLFPAHVSET